MGVSLLRKGHSMGIIICGLNGVGKSTLGKEIMGKRFTLGFSTLYCLMFQRRFGCNELKNVLFRSLAIEDTNFIAERIQRKD